MLKNIKHERGILYRKPFPTTRKEVYSIQKKIENLRLLSL
jgi:hypothetical protein